MKRRHFVKSLGFMGSGFFLSTAPDVFPGAPAFTIPSSIDDEGSFKLLRRQFLLPDDYVYLNTGGIGASPMMVLQAVEQQMARENTYPAPSHNEKEWWDIKEKCAAMLGPTVKKEELALTGSATEGINIVLNGLPLKKGDEVITSSHEHVALVLPLINKMKRAGIKVKVFAPDLAHGPGNVRNIEKLMTKRTRLIFISHITCTTGQVLPVKEIAQLARARKVWLAVDGAQAVGHMPLDVKDLGADFYMASGHKWLLGPKRTGILYVREDLLDTLHPSVIGAYSGNDLDLEKKWMQFQPNAQRYEYATENGALFFGLREGINLLSTVGMPLIWQHNKRLAEMCYAELSRLPNIVMLSPTEEKYRSAMITFTTKNHGCDGFPQLMEKRRIRVRSVPEAQLKGVRLSFHLYNNEPDIARFLEETRSLLGSPSST